MRQLILSGILAAALVPRGAIAQESMHVAVEATTLVLEDARVSRLGLAGATVSTAGGTGVTVVNGPGNVVVGTRIGSLDVAAWLNLLRRERAVRQESRQQIVVLSGAAAQVASERSVVGPYGYGASAGPRLWVAPEALDGGLVRLRVWSSVGDVEVGRFGTVHQRVPIEGSTEIVVPSGTPVLIASTDVRQETSEQGLLSRGSSRGATQGWIVVTPRIVEDAAQAFPLPEGIPEEWLLPRR